MGKRGNPRLIVDGHTFFKKSTYKTKCFWYCKFNRNQFKCQATCWTRNGQIVKWPTGHTHAVIPELINPEEDTVVPIERFREVLIQAALSKLLYPNLMSQSFLTESFSSRKQLLRMEDQIVLRLWHFFFCSIPIDKFGYYYSI